jgi:hypothetical protein
MKRLAFALALAVACAAMLPATASAKKAPPTPGPMSTAAMPACAAGDPVVWVNSSTKVFHEKGTPWFGRTKAGMYACKSAAIASGAHAAGMRGKHGSSTASMAPEGKKKHKKGGEASAMPMASPSPK